MLTDRNQYLASLVDKNNTDIHCFKNEKASLEDQLAKLVSCPWNLLRCMY